MRSLSLVRSAFWLLALLLAGNALAFSPQKIFCGEVTNFMLKEEAPVLEWQVSDFGPAPTLGTGEKFAVVSIRLTAGHSIGKYDFTLANAKCLALSYGIKKFNPALWERAFAADDPDAWVNLLYKVPAEKGPFELTFTYNVPGIPARERICYIDVAKSKAPKAAAETPPAELETKDDDVPPLEEEKPAAPAEPVDTKPPPKKEAPPATVKTPAPPARPLPNKTPAKPPVKKLDDIDDW